MKHTWTARKHPLATSCRICGRPLVPLKVPKDWRNHLNEWRSADDCPGAP